MPETSIFWKAFALKAAGIVGAALLLLIQAFTAKETADVNKDTSTLIKIDSQMLKDLEQIQALIQKKPPAEGP